MVRRTLRNDPFASGFSAGDPLNARMGTGDVLTKIATAFRGLKSTALRGLKSTALRGSKSFTLRGVLNSALRGLIRLYQLGLSPILPPSCRYLPSCSHYAAEAIAVHGALHGSVLAARRLCRCHPWGGSGYDPVPPPSSSSRIST